MIALSNKHFVVRDNAGRIVDQLHIRTGRTYDPDDPRIQQAADRYPDLFGTVESDADVDDE